MCERQSRRTRSVPGESQFNAAKTLQATPKREHFVIGEVHELQGLHFLAFALIQTLFRAGCSCSKSSWTRALASWTRARKLARIRAWRKWATSWKASRVAERCRGWNHTLPVHESGYWTNKSIKMLVEWVVSVEVFVEQKLKFTCSKLCKPNLAVPSCRGTLLQMYPKKSNNEVLLPYINVKSQS